MCLGVPGEVVELLDGADHLARVEVSGVGRLVNVGLLEDDPVRCGDWVLIHVGFAIAKIDEDEARLALASLRMLGGSDGDELDELLRPPDGWEASP